jgi:hypothetical protein
MRDRSFLQTILPISSELNFILQRIFDVDPQRRISLAELRDLIVCCPRLTQGSPCNSLPPSPPYTPDVKVAQPVVLPPDVADVPPMDPLPGLQYPPPPTTLTLPSRPFRPQHQNHNLPTPPDSANCSPELSPYTFQTKPAVPACSPFVVQPGVAPAFPTWSRCGQYVANFAIPRSACFWNSLPVY